MTKQQLIQLIHIARNDLKMDEDTYRQMLQGLTGRASTKGMDFPQLTKVLESMKKKGFRVKPAGNAKTGIALDDHPQSRKIRALWLDMAAEGVIRDSSELSLARWVKRETGVDG
ncbi:gp16 family protein, partial [Yersinia enterocolitica]